MPRQEKLILKNFQCVNQSLLSFRVKTLTLSSGPKALPSLLLEPWVKTSSCELNLPQKCMWVCCVHEEQEKQVGCWCPSCHKHHVPIVSIWRNDQLPAGVDRFCGFLSRNGNCFGWNCWASRRGRGKGLKLEGGVAGGHAFPWNDFSRSYIDLVKTKLRHRMPFGFWQRSRCFFQLWNKAEKNAEIVL